MDWKTIKHIYRCVLIHKYEIEYLGEDRFRVTKCFELNRRKEYWETVYLSNTNTYTWDGPYELANN